MFSYDDFAGQVLPLLDLPLREKYPDVSLQADDAFLPLAEQSITMLVALTGTGKSTTINQLMASGVRAEQLNALPSRREVADWIAIPTAQVLQGETIQAVKDRVARFHYTKVFADHVAGGMARAFSWLRYRGDHEQVLISEGIRGANEITFVLENFPKWQVVELALNPVTRLRRLTSREDVFDKAEGAGDVEFLPENVQDEVLGLVEAGEISRKALTIMQAEAGNYGLYAYGESGVHPNYHCIEVDGMDVDAVAGAVLRIMKAKLNASN